MSRYLVNRDIKKPIFERRQNKKKGLIENDSEPKWQHEVKP